VASVAADSPLVCTHSAITAASKFANHRNSAASRPSRSLTTIALPRRPLLTGLTLRHRVAVHARRPRHDERSTISNRVYSHPLGR
jgi:hypothetical protein